MSYKCLVCGGKMKKVKSADKVWECTECGAVGAESCYGGLAFDAEYFDDYGEENDVGCTGCGNSAYPNCKSSCPLFDN